MAPMKKVEIPILYLTYESPIKRSTERVRMARLAHPTTVLKPIAAEWLWQTIRAEKSQIPSGMEVEWVEWHITTDDPELFEAYGKRYEKLYIVIGEDTVYWCFQPCTLRRMSGRSNIPVVCCPCCLSENYKTIVKQVQEETKKEAPGK